MSSDVLKVPEQMICLNCADKNNWKMLDDSMCLGPIHREWGRCPECSKWAVIWDREGFRLNGKRVPGGRVQD